jgi:leucyl-tRNA synthetase
LYPEDEIVNEYDPQKIEAKWQAVWDAERIFYTPDPTPESAPEKHWYMLEMLPYPSGKEMHMGHVLNYTMGDVVTHFRRRNGWTVLRPMGWDAFGLPAENAAIREGGHPRETTERNIATMRGQMQRLGWAIDWDREVSAHRPDFYRWTQWLFLRFFEQGLAYRKEAPVNWCPKDQTVIANEYVVDGLCERCGTPVELRNLTQWFFKVTAYADELLEYELPPDGWWPERTKTIQRNWIGRSEGAAILFRVEELDIDIEVFTTRPDTIFGATFFVVAPEHAFVEAHASEEAQAYARHAGARRTEERAADQAKTGVFTGYYVTNPATGEKLPVYVADYVLMDYGTGAIMAVPGHDERDREFAEAFDLPVVEVIDEDGRMINSGQFDGAPAEDAKGRIVTWLREIGRGAPAVSFRLRDWSFSRQRYWGSPIPIVYCDDCGIVPVRDEDLPVLLPEVDDFLPKGKAPLATNEEWMNVPCPRCGKPGRREADTMDTFVDSSWYYLRYTDPRNDHAPFDRALVDYWLPINQYIGGIDHATGHLLYSRFFVKAMNDMGMVGFREPFARLFHQGWVELGGKKMSKTRGNVEGPSGLVESYGADAVRLYILSMGPADQDMEWTPAAIGGIARFLRRLWRIVHEVVETPPRTETRGALTRKAHQTIAKVTDDIGRRFQFHTPISAVRELVNELVDDPAAPDARFAAETAVSLIQPYAPHIAEELWGVLGHERLWEQPWPTYDPALLERETFELVVQVNGRVRDRVEVSSESSEDELVEAAKSSERVQSFLDGKQIRQTVVVPGKLVNLVVA